MTREKVIEAFNYAQSLGVAPYEIENYYRIWFNKEINRWLDPNHQRFWYLFSDGTSCLSSYKKEICGIWVSDTVVIHPEILLEERSFTSAKEFAFGKKAGNVNYDICRFNQMSNIFNNISHINFRLKKAGYPVVPQTKLFWSIDMRRTADQKFFSACSCDGFETIHQDIEVGKACAFLTIDFSAFK